MQKMSLGKIGILLRSLMKQDRNENDKQLVSNILYAKDNKSSMQKGSLYIASSIYQSAFGCGHKNLNDFLNAYIELCSLLELLNNSFDVTENYKESSKLHNILYSALDFLEERQVSISQNGMRYISHIIGKLANTCRTCLLSLPGCFDMFDAIKEHAQLYCNITLRPKINNRFYTYAVKKQVEEYLEKHPEFYWWELSAAFSSPFLVILDVMAMSLAASDPAGTEILKNLNFPWLSCYHSLLEHFSRLHSDISANIFNPVNCYKNLVKFEKRVLFLRHKCLSFVDKGEKAYKALDLLLKSIALLYLSEPGAQYGIYKITSERIIKSMGIPFYFNALKLAREKFKAFKTGI